MCDLDDAVSIGDLEAVRSLLLMSGEAGGDEYVDEEEKNISRCSTTESGYTHSGLQDAHSCTN